MEWKVDKFTVRPEKLTSKWATEWGSTVVGMLRGLEALASGRALMNGFRAYGRDVLVVPYFGDLGQCNAWADSSWGIYGTKVAISPRTWYSVSPCFSTNNAGALADEVLVHELVHALRIAAGTIDQVADEEQLAIMITNIYSSELKGKLRYDHNGFAERIGPVTSTSAGYYRKFRPMVDAFCKQHSKVSRWLATVQTSFNPLAQYWSQVPVAAGGWKQ